MIAGTALPQAPIQRKRRLVNRDGEPRVLRQLAPSNAYYEHNDFGRRTVNMNPDECANGHAHCQHLFLASSETVPVIDGKTALGTYQRIFLIELDHPRMRKVLVTVVGC